MSWPRRRVTTSASLAACLIVGIALGWITLGGGADVAIPPSSPAREQMSAARVEAPADSATIASGEIAFREVVPIVDVPRSSLVVECTYGRDMRPVAAADVTVVRVDIDPPMVVPVGRTDDQGRVLCSGLAPGAYQVQAVHDSMVSLGPQVVDVTLEAEKENWARFTMARVYVGVLAFDGIESPYDVRFAVGSRTYEDATAGGRSLGSIHARLLDRYGPYFRLFATASDISPGASEVFYLFFKDYETQQVAVPLVPLDQFREPTMLSRSSLTLRASSAPKVMLRVVDSTGRSVDAGRWMLIRSAATSGLESVDVASNVWRYLPHGEYRIRGHALYCPWVFSSTEKFVLDEGGQYDFVVAATFAHRRASVAVQWRGVAAKGMQGRFVGLDAIGKEHRGAWMDFSSSRAVDLPVGTMGLELTYRGRTALFDIVVADQDGQLIAVDWAS